MDTRLKSNSYPQSSFLPATLGVLAALLIASVLTQFNTRLPFVNTDQGAFIALSVLGFAMCATGGIGVTLQKRGWKDAITIIGEALGILALALIIAVIFGVQLPFTANIHAAFLALSAICAAKVAVKDLDNAVRK
jgi:hypothetical protein